MNEQAPAHVPVGKTETVAEALTRLNAAGYTDDFRAEAAGLRAMKRRCLHGPEALVVDEIVRFEGITDPADEAIVFALHCKLHGTKGTYVTSYGPSMTALDADMVRRLQMSGR